MPADGSKRAVVSETASPQIRGEHKRSSPLAFPAAPHRHMKKTRTGATRAVRIRRTPPRHQMCGLIVNAQRKSTL